MVGEPGAAASLAALERASLRAWPPRESEALGGWRLRHGGARSRRLDSVQTGRFDVELPVADAIARVERWYAERGSPACFHLTDAAQPAGLDAALAARRYRIVTPTSVLAADAAALPGSPAAEVELRPAAEVELVADAGPELLDAICDPGWPAAVRLERAALFARIGPAHRFALARIDGRPAAAGLCVADGELAGIFSVRTQPEYRRRGLAAAVLLRLVVWARSCGTRRVYLQVEDESAPALALYRRSGFARVYGYRYRELDLS